jgi:tetratricopeptide (TPR) repeat protein
MKSADKAMKDKEYLDALKYYKEVVREDSSNYSKAQNNIKTCIKDMYDYYINEAEQMNSKGYYEDAYKTVKSIKEYYPDDPIIKSKMDTYLNNLFDATIKKADELNAGKKFDNAISTLESLKAYFPNNQKIAEKVSLYKKNKIAAALAEQEKVEKRKKELLAQTSQRYDKEYGMKVYSPKGLDTYYVNIDDKLNIEPRMYTLADSSAGLMFFIGYAQDEYINFSKLIFDIDGEIIEQEIPESVKKSEFYNPGVAEWCTLSAINNSKLVEQIKKLAYGTNSKIIFEGNKYRNHVLTKKEKDNLKLFIELFGYYNQVNESMISDDSPGQST